MTAFEEFGIPRHLIQEEVHTIRLVSPSGEKVDIGLGRSPLTVIDRRVFDPELRRLAEERGARIVEGEFLDVSGGVKCVVEMTDGRERHEITCSHIIASDGVNSRVRTAIGIKPARAFFTLSERIVGPSSGCCEFWFGTHHAPRSYSWVFPASDGISIGTGSHERGTIKECLDRFKERSGIRTEGERRVYRIPVWSGDLYNKDRVLFAGDSAGQVLPLTYEGIYYAMRSGEYAARAIIENKVENYKKMWKSKFQRRFALMNALGDHFLKDDVSAGRLVALHRRPEIQEASLRLWTMKDSSGSLAGYIRFFGKFLR